MVVVLEPAQGRNLTEIATVKRELGLLDTEEDAFLEQAIAEASALAASYCDRVFARELLEEEFERSGGGPGALLLSRWPVRRIVELEENGLLLPQAAWRLDARAGLLWRTESGRRLVWSGRLRVLYEAGWLLPGAGGLRDLPADVERAALELVKTIWFSRQRDPRLTGEAAAEVYQGSYLAELPPLVRQLLSPFKAQRG